MLIAILSDIHANLTALNSALDDINKKCNVDAYMLLGDVINYGMRPNEVVDTIAKIEKPIIGNIWGNHEKALFDDSELVRFSSDRGRQILKYTKQILDAHSLNYIKNRMNNNGLQELVCGDKSILLIHGDLTDVFWGKMNAQETILEKYKPYDYVLHGHSHIPSYSEVFFQDDNPILRNKKKTVFINPGSVGQPRNHNNRAQYAILDTESEAFCHYSVEYNIIEEQILFTGDVDDFYKIRLQPGV